MAVHGRMWLIPAGERVGGEKKEGGYGLGVTGKSATEKGEVGKKGA